MKRDRILLVDFLKRSTISAVLSAMTKMSAPSNVHLCFSAHWWKRCTRSVASDLYQRSHIMATASKVFCRVYLISDHHSGTPSVMFLLTKAETDTLVILCKRYSQFWMTLRRDCMVGSWKISHDWIRFVSATSIHDSSHMEVRAGN